MRVLACVLVLGLFGVPGAHSTTKAGDRVSAGPSAPSTSHPPAAYLLPLSGPLRVVRPFVAPVTAYGPGHRGVDLASTSGQTVLAAAAGTVTFAGSVAGRGVVVIAHRDGIRTEYEPVRASVSLGAVVVAGQPIGVVDGVHAGCAPPGSCLHWGARRGSAYFDPLTLLEPLGIVRLLPLAG